MKLPSVGRIVHYVSYGTQDRTFESEHRAAIVTDVHNPNEPKSVLSLCVINPTGLYFSVGICYDEDCKPGTWHWPEYVAEV